MKHYFVVNENVKTKFEKEYQVPFGYYAMPHFKTEEGAIEFVGSMKEPDRIVSYVEKCECGNSDIVYRGAWYDKEVC
jgi:hypothetical protein